MGPGQAAPKGLVWSGRVLYIGHRNNLSPANKVHCKWGTEKSPLRKKPPCSFLYTWTKSPP